jgi:hypothetical protein
MKPDRSTSFSVAMFPVDAAQGVFGYTTLTSDLDMIGMWTCTVVISAQGFHATYGGEIGFLVKDQPD